MGIFTKRLAAAGLAILFAATFVRPLAADRADKRELIRQARAAYYSTRRFGLDSYQVNIAVNWEVVLKNENSNPAQKQNALRMLNGLHFAQSFDANGKSIITHRADVPAPNAQVQSGYDQIFSGMDQAITGFMDTYQIFMVTTPLPAVDGVYTLDDAPYGYRLTYKDGNSDIITRLTKDLAIIEMIVNAPEFDSSVRPTFSRVDGLYVIDGYEGDYRPTTTKTGIVKLSAKIDHTLVDGLRLPGRIYFKSSIDDAGTETELTFSGYTVKKK